MNHRDNLDRRYLPTIRTRVRINRPEHVSLIQQDFPKMPHPRHIREPATLLSKLAKHPDRPLNDRFDSDVFRDRVQVVLRFCCEFVPLHAAPDFLDLDSNRRISCSRNSSPSTTSPRSACSAPRLSFAFSALCATSRSRSCNSSKRSPSRTTSLAV